MATVTERIPVLSEAAEIEFERFLKKAEQFRKANGYKRERDTARDAVLEEMGDAMLAQLPSGRRVQRTRKSMHQKARPAADYAWDELSEVPA